MSLLEQYEKEHPKAFREPKWEPSKEYGGFIRLVMRISGGRIQDVRQASAALLIVAGIFILISLFLFFSGGRPKPLPEHLRVPVAGPEAEERLRRQ